MSWHCSYMDIEYHTSTTDTSRVIRAVAHRGAKALAQENSIEAFTRAAEYGVPAIETDVRLAADFGVPIIHDRTLERTYGHPGVVAGMTTTELRELGVPQLSELLAGFGGDHDIYIDLKEKCAILADAVGRVVAESGRASRAWVTGSNLKQLRRVQSVAPELRISWTIGTKYGTLNSAAVVEAAILGVPELAVNAPEVSVELVAQADSLGIDVRAYGIKTVAAARALVALGCTTLTLDDPRWVAQVGTMNLPIVSGTT